MNSAATKEVKSLVFSEREVTFTFAMSSSVRLSVVSSVVCNVLAPYSGELKFSAIFLRH